MALAWDLREYFVRAVHNLSDSSYEESCSFSKTNIRRRRKERERHAPSPLPESRKRRLTATDHLSQSDGGTLRLRNQAKNSYLLSRLPLEIRLLIWTLVVAGSDVIHIARLRRRMVGFRCTEPHRLADRKHRCWGEYKAEYPGIYTEKRLRNIPGINRDSCSRMNALALLRTCRQAYTEAIYLLYSENCFHFNSLETIIAFPPTIFSHRFHSIRSMSLTLLLCQVIFNMDSDKKIEPPHDIHTWRQIWTIIGPMRGLRHLNVVLHILIRPDESGEGEDERILEPVRVMKPPTQVSVTLVWGSEERADGEGRNFQLEDNISVVRQPLWSYRDNPKYDWGFPDIQWYDED